MDEVTSSYLTALDELNTLTSTSYYNAAGQDLAARANQIADDVLSFLIKAYTMGIESASVMLDHEMTVDVDDMREAIFLGLFGRRYSWRQSISYGNTQGFVPAWGSGRVSLSDYLEYQ